ncbi:hypothetical protein GWK47_021853 [Chionoecetes opilio]|uniref:Uncharacterized protein n=1 Tax=Chionoecetes opilio TaxID=41210 RepID=A0A8J4XNH4_CHIOP|nr:hypothetical protein GWK47_021853 [Chionoecetes opilio]
MGPFPSWKVGWRGVASAVAEAPEGGSQSVLPAAPLHELVREKAFYCRGPSWALNRRLKPIKGTGGFITKPPGPANPDELPPPPPEKGGQNFLGVAVFSTPAPARD